MLDLANRVLPDREGLGGRLCGPDDKVALEDILSVGTSAGGARAKAVLAWNPRTGEFRSGQVEAGEGFENWLLKFDGVASTGIPSCRMPRVTVASSMHTTGWPGRPESRCRTADCTMKADAATS